MANAPSPSAARRNRARDRVIKITVRGDEATIRPADFGARDDSLVRRETKIAGVERVSLMGALQAMDEGTVGLDLVCLLWWLGRRKAGDTTMSYGEALDGFPSYAEAEDQITFEEIVDDDEADGSPEA
jgi:hypothetical protein